MSITPVMAESTGSKYETIIDSVTKELTEKEECLGTEYYINGTQVSGSIAVGTYLDENYNSCDQQNASWKVIGDDSAENNKRIESEITELTGITDTLVAIEYYYSDDGIIIDGKESAPNGEAKQIRHYERVEYYTKKTTYMIIVNLLVEPMVVEPTEPTKPVEPTEPTEPAELTNPTNPTESVKKSKGVNTGVISNMVLWISLAISSLICYFGLVSFKKYQE